MSIEGTMEYNTRTGLARKRTVLDHSYPGGNYRIFDQEPEEGEESPSLSVEVRLPLEDWTDMGQPHTLTVAIWPGDRQDIMESDEFPA